MPKRDNQLWREVSPYLDEALDLDQEARETYLRKLDETLPHVARELRRLLNLHTAIHASGFLEQSPITPDDFVIGHKIGAYTIERLLGRGGMGSVWLGRRSDESFEGVAAVKLLDSRGLGPFAITQIRHEANLLARLSHAHIARLFDAGVRENGQPYLVLEYVEGAPIDEHCRSEALPLPRRLDLFLGVLDAVAYAQGQLIVHGDLKPSNVLVTDEGGIKLVDFGVASLRTDPYTNSDEPAVHPRALTPGYAPPEQVRGEPLSAAADVYALGVLLHVLVTGKHPFGAGMSTGTELIKATMTDDPPSASAQIGDALEQRRVRGDLDAIIARALDRDPARRYPTAADFAADIRRFLGNFPVQARTASRAYVARKFAQRHWGGVLSVLLTVILLTGGIAIVAAQMIEARHQRDFARRQLARAESLNELMGYVLTDAAPAGKPFTVNELLGRAAHLLERQHADDTDRAALLTSIGRQYDTQDEDGAAIKYLSEAYGLSQHATDVSVRARAACAFASTLARDDNSGRPEALFQESLEQLPDGAEFALDRSFCWMNGEKVALAHGDAPQAVERARTSVTMLDEVPFEHEIAELRAKAELAEAYRDAGHYREAVEIFEALWPRLLAQGRDDTATAGTWLNNWGVALAQMGRPLEAEGFMRRSMDIHRADTSDDALSPMLMTNYAQQLLDLGRLSDAQSFAERALAAARRADDEVVINQTLLRLARIYRAQHDFDRSIAELDAVEPRLRKALPPDHYAFAALASERSQTLELQGDTARALELANAAVLKCEDLDRQGKACKQYLPNMLRHRASVEIALGQWGAAEIDARRALALLQTDMRPGEFRCRQDRRISPLRDVSRDRTDRSTPDRPLNERRTNSRKRSARTIRIRAPRGRSRAGPESPAQIPLPQTMS